MAVPEWVVKALHSDLENVLQEVPKVLDAIAAGGGTFRVAQTAVGQSRHNPSYAVGSASCRTPGVDGHYAAAWR